MKYAYIENNIVRECVEANPYNLFAPGYAARFVEVPDDVQAGWLETDGSFTPPEYVPVIDPPPTSVTMRQARLQLLALGNLATINTAIGTMSEAAQIEWEYGLTVDRSNPLTAAMVNLLGWSDEQTYDYFRVAAEL